jgi:hypothetical protein
VTGGVGVGGRRRVDGEIGGLRDEGRVAAVIVVMLAVAVRVVVVAGEGMVAVGVGGETAGVAVGVGEGRAVGQCAVTGGRSGVRGIGVVIVGYYIGWGAGEGFVTGVCGAWEEHPSLGVVAYVGIACACAFVGIGRGMVVGILEDTVDVGCRAVESHQSFWSVIYCHWLEGVVGIVGCYSVLVMWCPIRERERGWNASCWRRREDKTAAHSLSTYSW